MTRTALILASHGSTNDPEVNEQIREYARQLKDRVAFDEIAVTFHQGDPHFSRVLDEITAHEVIVVPVMISDGYYCNTVLPRELAKNARYSNVKLQIRPPLGVHQSIEQLVEQRIDSIVDQFKLDRNETTIVIVGHGTPKNPQSRISTIDLVAKLAEKNVSAQVISAFLDEEPLVETVLKRCEHFCVVVIPFLIGAGAHASRDIPRRMGLEVDPGASRPILIESPGFEVILDAAIGTDPGIVDIIAEMAGPQAGKGHASRADEHGRAENFAIHARSRALRLGTRSSEMALWQARHVADKLLGFGHAIELVEMTTSGDRQLNVPIHQLPSDAPFTDDIEVALRAGEIDLAVHSLKDLPVDIRADLALAAILPRGDASESFVSHGAVRLAELPEGSMIGTSSPRRVSQLLAMRPDLKSVSIRGAVDARVRDIQAGKMAGAILATVGLQRLGLESQIAQRFSFNRFLPAPGQAALAVQVRADDEETRALIAPLDDLRTRRITEAEIAAFRYFYARDDVAFAAYAYTQEGRIHLRARLMSLDGTSQSECRVAGFDATALATEAARNLASSWNEQQEAAA